ncbi:uncharacterized protein LOC124452666 [Xenia sp. Carnegie-2017]|uniref:uncharacterized protein LOC124452666 n=1 Tax=Xenia sp. Carnegie-2017 TaxID=2897299 RepID=UPI001F04B7D4|nr:uncharacterized protein LOC124452666 [Xenia sp. Carnegie-2017]
MSYVFSSLLSMENARRIKAKPVVLVVGCNSKVAKATINTLSTKYARKLKVHVGFQLSELLENLKASSRVTTVKEEMEEFTKMKAAFADVQALLIVAPYREDGVEFVSKTVNAAKKAGVKHILLLSSTYAATGETTYGKQFYHLEQAVMAGGIPFTILRLPWLMENFFVYKHTIKSHMQFFVPGDPKREFETVCVGDAGAAAAAVLASPLEHVGKVYSVVGDWSTLEKVSSAMTSTLSKVIACIQVPYDEALGQLIRNDMVDENLEEYSEFYKTLDSASQQTLEENQHYQYITGKSPTKLISWMNRHADVFN